LGNLAEERLLDLIFSEEIILNRFSRVIYHNNCLLWTPLA
jgi:hypothetical protein